MKLVLMLLWLATLAITGYSQQRSFVVYPRQVILARIPKDAMYAYPEFTQGVIHYKSRKRTLHKMNYNLLLDQVQFITPKGDTTSIGDQYFKFIVLQKDTFYYDRFYYRIFKEYDKIKLVYKTGFSFISRSRPSMSNGLTVYSTTYSNDTVRFVRSETFYMLDLRDKLYTLQPENLVEIYPHRQKDLVNYLSERKVNFYSRKDVEDLMEFLNTRKYH
jgi:hypothetical protein